MRFVRPSRLLALAGASAALTTAALVGAGPAQAASTVEQIADSCGKQPVCVYDGAHIKDAAAVEKALPKGVQVVVIPQPDQAQSISSGSVANGVKKASDATTVIVIEDQPAKDRFAVASDDDAAAISKQLYAQNQADGGAAVVAIADDLAPEESGGGPPIGGILTGVIALVVVLGGGWFGITTARKRKVKRGETRLEQDKRLAHDLDEALDGEDGRFVRGAIDELYERAADYPQIGQHVNDLAGHVSDLFVRVENRGTDQQMRLLQSQYKDTLAKLLKGLGHDYYGDILANPQYWSGPEARRAEVHRAIDAVDKQVVDNIKQVNESRDLEFQVALGSLVAAVDEAKLSDVYKDDGQ